MPRHDCFRPANARAVEVTHSSSAVLRIWGEVCKAAGVQRGKAQASARFQRMIGPKMLMGARHDPGGGAGHDGKSCCEEAGPMGDGPPTHLCIARLPAGRACSAMPSQGGEEGYAVLGH